MTSVIPVVVSRPKTAKRAAKVAIRVPAISNLTASQQFALRNKNEWCMYYYSGIRRKDMNCNRCKGSVYVWPMSRGERKREKRQRERGWERDRWGEEKIGREGGGGETEEEGEKERRR